MALLALAVHVGVWNHDLLQYDDDIDLNPELPAMRSGLTLEGISWALTSTLHGNWIPLTRLSWLLDVSIFGFGARPFLVGNVIYHAVAAATLFVALRAMTGATSRSAVAAALFAVHPLHVESVAWAVERKDVLCGVFWMATILAYTRWANAPSRARYAVVAVSMALALAAKPMAISLPLVLLILDLWPLARIKTGGALEIADSLVRRIAEKIPLFLLSGVAALVTVHTQLVGHAVRDLASFSLRERLSNAVLAYWAYVRNFVWPADLAVFYPHPQGSISHEAATLGTVAFVIVTSAATLAARRTPYVTSGWLWFVVTLIPVIGIVQVGYQALADRYMYMPLVGLAILVSWGGADLAQIARIPRLVRVSAVASLLAAFALVTVAQVGYWKDTETLFRRALAVTEGNWVAHRSLGGVALDRNDLDAAIFHYRESLRIEPVNPPVRASLGSILLAKGELDTGIALLRGAIDEVQLHGDGSEEDAQLVRAAERLMFEAIQSHIDGSRSSLPEAAPSLEQLRAAALRWPQLSGIHGEIGLALVRIDRFLEAEEALRLAVANDPESARWNAAHGHVLQVLGRTPDALAAYRAALRVEPLDPHVINNVALILATSPDDSVRNPKEAIALAESAVAALGRRDPASLDTLAAAYLAAGRTRKALEIAHEALERAQEAGDAEAIARLEERIDSFKRN